MSITKIVLIGIFAVAVFASVITRSFITFVSIVCVALLLYLGNLIYKRWRLRQYKKYGEEFSEEDNLEILFRSAMLAVEESDKKNPLRPKRMRAIVAGMSKTIGDKININWRDGTFSFKGNPEHNVMYDDEFNSHYFLDVKEEFLKSFNELGINEVLPIIKSTVKNIRTEGLKLRRAYQKRDRRIEAEMNASRRAR